MMRPETEAQLIEAVRGAEAPLAITGGGTRRVGTPSGQMLQTGGLTGITLYDPGALTLVARAGTPLDQIEAVLAAENQRLAFEPPRLGAVLGRVGDSTLGGVVAANASGPRRVQAGACRDSLIGVSFIDGTGTLIRNGGRVMKNVTGYDLVKLLAGSQGSLGVLTELSFKLLPRPQTEASLLLEGLNPAEASRAMTRALATPFEVSGAAMLPAEEPGRHTVALRLEGFNAQVEGRLPRLAAALSDIGAARLLQDPEASAALWAGIRDLTPLAALLQPPGLPGRAPDPGPDSVSGSASGSASAPASGSTSTLTQADQPKASPPPNPGAGAAAGSTTAGAMQLWRLSIRPSRMPALLAGLADSGTAVLADWGGGLVWLAGSAPELPGLARGFVAAEGGHATRLLGPATPEFPAFQPEAPAVARLTEALRARFDPRGLFTPRMMG